MQYKNVKLSFWHIICTVNKQKTDIFFLKKKKKKTPKITSLKNESQPAKDIHWFMLNLAQKLHKKNTPIAK